jgi:hypothetical protein
MNPRDIGLMTDDTLNAKQIKENFQRNLPKVGMFLM